MSRKLISKFIKVAASLSVVAFASINLVGCTSLAASNVKSNAELTPNSHVTYELTTLPKPKSKLAVAVYMLRDQTGQYKPSPDSSYSNSVTQGAASILIKALRDSGWYTPVEREGLQNLLTERKIIHAIPIPGTKEAAISLPSLTPAVLIVEGGVIAFESNVRTGGKGANYLGLGSNDSYRIDQVTVSLRLVDTQTGQILDTVSVTKTIYSYAYSASLYAFVKFQKLLQAEGGFTTNEPVQLAVREAIEAAVVHLTSEGIRNRYLVLNDDSDINSPVVQKYLKESRDNASDGMRENVSANIGFKKDASMNRLVFPMNTQTIPAVTSK